MNNKRLQGMEENSPKGITIIGLGPGDEKLLTREAWDIILNAEEIYLRTAQHPVIGAFPKSLKVISFDSYYADGEQFESVYEKIANKVIEMGQRSGGVIYAVPGHPFVAEATTPLIIHKAGDIQLPVRIVEGLSFLESTFKALEIDPFQNIVLLDALEIGCIHHPNFSPVLPALIAQIYSRQIASDVKLTLNAVYPDAHMVYLVHAAGTKDMLVEELQLYEIDRSDHIALLTNLYVPPLNPNTSFEVFQDIIAHLRAPDGCPWDRKQTHQTLRQNLLEETYEVLQAIDANDPESMAEEFGDLLLQIVLHAQIASEDGEFSMTDILSGIHDKLVNRHPHVFGGLEVDGVSDVLLNWEKLKAEERKNGNHKIDKGILGSVPIIVPALEQAQEYQARVARVGFDWHNISGILEKIKEEFEEVQQADNLKEKENEIGDLLFSVVNLARRLNVNAESALRVTNERFKKRFQYIENKAREQKMDLYSMTLEEMDRLWDEAKSMEDKS